MAGALAAGLPWLPVAGAAPQRRPAPLSPAVTFFGRTGSFGTVTTDPRITTRSIPNWVFHPGQAAYFTTMAPTGQIVIANEPQTDNQLQPTAEDMAVSTFDPATSSFRTIVIPGSGPADVSDVVAAGDRVAFISSHPGPAHPAFGWLTGSPTGLNVDPSTAKTATQLARSSAEDSACPKPDCRGLAEMGRLPRSGDLVVTQYFDDPGHDRASGGLLVLSPSGDVISYYPYPNVAGPDGAPLSIHPREVDVDPTSPPGRERFAVVFDVFARDGAPASTGTPFTLQEFAFDGSRIRPTSAAFTTGYLGPLGRAGFETAMFDHHGNLWAAESYQGSLSSAPLVEYRGGAARCQATGWAATCTPDLDITDAALLGQARSLNEDPATGAVFETTMSGFVLPVVNGQARPAIDLGLDHLVDRSLYWISPRKGSVDPASHRLWIPIQQLQSPAVCARYPCPPPVLDQWLVSVDLSQLIG